MLDGWVTWVERRLWILLDIVRKPEGQRGLSVLPRRWVVEGTLSWITAHRRLARDYERTPSTPKPGSSGP